MKKPIFVTLSIVIVLLLFLVIAVIVMSPSHKAGQGLKTAQTSQNEAPGGQNAMAGLPASTPADTQKSTELPPVSAETGKGGVTINYELIQALLVNMPTQRQQLILNNANVFVRMVADEAQHQALLNTALEKGVHKQASAQFLMRRSSGDALKGYFLRQYLNNGVAADYPNEAQVREQYETKPEKYTLPRRVHLWQIFLPMQEGADEEVAKKTLREIEDIEKQLRSGKIGTAEAVRRHSLHGPSKRQGGYMGLVVVDQLREPFQRALATLPKGQISKPVRDQDGYHLIWHDGFVEGRRLPLAEAASTVRNDLRIQARESLQSQLLKESLSKYPHSVKDEQVRDWWQRLRAQAGISSEGETAADKEQTGSSKS